LPPEAVPTDGVPFDVRPAEKNYDAPTPWTSSEGWRMAADNPAPGRRRLRAVFTGEDPELAGIQVEIGVEPGRYTLDLRQGKKRLGTTEAQTFTLLLQGLDDTRISPEAAESLRWSLLEYLRPDEAPESYEGVQWLTGRPYVPPKGNEEAQLAAAEAAVDQARAYAKEPEAAQKVTMALRGAAQVAVTDRAAEALEDAAEVVEGLGRRKSPIAIELDRGPTSVDALQDSLEQRMTGLPPGQRIWVARHTDKGWSIEPARNAREANLVISRRELERATPDQVRLALEGASLEAKGEVDPKVLQALRETQQLEVVDPRLTLELGPGEAKAVAQALRPHVGKGISSEFVTAISEIVRRNDPGIRADTALLLARKLHPPGQERAELAGAMSPGERSIIAFSEHTTGKGRSPEERMERVLHEFIHHYTLNLPTDKRVELERALENLHFPQQNLNTWEQIAYRGTELILQAASTGELKSVMPEGKRRHQGIRLDTLRDQKIVREWLDNAVKVLRAQVADIDQALQELEGRHDWVPDGLEGDRGYGRQLLKNRAAEGDPQNPATRTGDFPTRDELRSWSTVYQTLADFLDPGNMPMKRIERRIDEIGTLYSLLGGPELAEMRADIEKTGLSPSDKRQMIDDLTHPIRQLKGDGLGAIDYSNQAYRSIDEFFNSPRRKRITAAFASDSRKQAYVKALEMEYQVWRRLKETGWVGGTKKLRGMDAVSAADVMEQIMDIDAVVGSNQKVGGYAVSLPIAACDPAIGKYTCCADCYVICTPSAEGPVYKRININSDAKIANRMKLMQLINTNPDGAAVLISRSFLRKAVSDVLVASQENVVKLSPKAVETLAEIHRKWSQAYEAARAEGGTIHTRELNMELDKLAVPEMLAALSKGGNILSKVNQEVSQREVKLEALRKKTRRLEAEPRSPETDVKIDALNAQKAKITQKSRVALAKLTDAYHLATMNTKLDQGWNPYLRFLDSGEVGNMQTVRTINATAQLLTPFDVEVQLFTRRPGFGQNKASRTDHRHGRPVACTASTWLIIWSTSSCAC
jgi:hypothetical protein